MVIILFCVKFECRLCFNWESMYNCLNKMWMYMNIFVVYWIKCCGYVIFYGVKIDNIFILN